MLVPQGHAGYIIGKSGAQIKELRMVLLTRSFTIVFWCAINVYNHNLLVLCQCVIERFDDKKHETVHYLVYGQVWIHYICKNWDLLRLGSLSSYSICAVEWGHRRRNCGDRSRNRPPRRSRRVVEHRIINNGGGSGWRVRCDEAWGEGNGTNDWPAMHGAYCTHHRHQHRHRGGVSNKTPPPTELRIPATVTTLVTVQPSWSFIKVK